MRSFGLFVGQIARAVVGPIPPKKVVRRDVEEAKATTHEGRTVTLRRTTIEEVEVHPPRSDDAR